MPSGSEADTLIEKLIEIYRVTQPGSPSGMNWWTDNVARVATNMGFGRAAGPVPGAILNTAKVTAAEWAAAQSAGTSQVGAQTGAGYFSVPPPSTVFGGTASDWFRRLAGGTGATGLSSQAGFITPQLLGGVAGGAGIVGAGGLLLGGSTPSQEQAQQMRSNPSPTWSQLGSNLLQSIFSRGSSPPPPSPTPTAASIGLIGPSSGSLATLDPHTTTPFYRQTVKPKPRQVGSTVRKI